MFELLIVLLIYTLHLKTFKYLFVLVVTESVVVLALPFAPMQDVAFCEMEDLKKERNAKFYTAR